MQTNHLLFTAAALLAGCASTGVVPASDDTFHIYRRGAGFVGSETIEAELTVQARQYCAERGMSMQVTNVRLGVPPYFRLRFPEADVRFKCVAANDLRSAESPKVAK